MHIMSGAVVGALVARGAAGTVVRVAHEMARVLRRSALHPDGINLLLCDGEAALQSVSHLHLHVIPRYVGDGWNLGPVTTERDRDALDEDARLIRSAVAQTSADTLGP